MTEHKAIPVLPLVAVFTSMVATLAAYVGGYLWLGELLKGPDHWYREYPSAWEVKVFTPAAWIETRLRGVEVETFCVERSQIPR
jgi:hypothetical protein